MATAYLMEDTVQALQVLTSDVFSGFGEFSDDDIRSEVGSMRSMGGPNTVRILIQRVG